VYEALSYWYMPFYVQVISSILRRNRAPSGGGLCVRACAAGGPPSRAAADSSNQHGPGLDKQKIKKVPAVEKAENCLGDVVDVFDSSLEGNEALLNGGGLALQGDTEEPLGYLLKSMSWFFQSMHVC
jgi:hypothetical protein